jgi:hypothetical protein
MCFFMEGRWMKRLLLSFAFLLAIASFACTERSTTQTSLEPGNIRQTGVYEDFQENRVHTYVFTAGTSSAEIREHAEQLPHRSDRLLAAYYFADGSRTIAANDLRWARSILHANDMLYDQPDLDPWHYAFMRTFVGETRFSDCAKSPDDALCRENSASLQQ